MLRKFFAISIYLLAVCSLHAAEINSQWVGGQEGQWGQAGNWSPAIVPDNSGGDTFTVTIDANSLGFDQANIGLTQSRTVNQIICNGVEFGKWISGWVQLELTDINGVTNYGNLEIEDEINIFGNITNKTGARLNGWFNIQDSNLTNQAEAKVDATDGYIDVHNGSVHNYGSIVTAFASGPCADKEFHNFGEIENYGGICSGRLSFTNYEVGIIKGYGKIYSNKIIANKGLIKSFGGDLILQSQPEFGDDTNDNSGITNTGNLSNGPGTSLTITAWPPDVNNNGAIEVNADGSVVFDCNLTNEPNGIIRLRGGTLASPRITQTAGADFNGFGTIKGDLIIEPNSPEEPDSMVKLTGPSMAIGDMKISTGASLQISDGQTLITGQTTNNGTIHLIGGTAIFQGGYTGDGQIINEAGEDRSQLDMNKDGIQDMQDFAVFADNWLWQASWY